MSIFNALQLPVTQIPIGLSDDGMPLGIQVSIIKKIKKLLNK